MHINKRQIFNPILHDLAEKMVFLGGPRQVGKTTLAFMFLNDGSEKHPSYVNWDSVSARSLLLNGELPIKSGLLVLDEIHKYRLWRNLVKGIYDTHKSSLKILVTGSARLDNYRLVGDSVQGRYHYYRLHPFSLTELNKNPNKNDLEQILQFGGFPEPLLKASQKFWRRWQVERLARLVQEDIISLENVRMLDQLQLLAQALPQRVGAPLSVKNLAQDIGVAFATIEQWLLILENLYFCFRISPFGVTQLRAAKKEKKIYLWDWSINENEGSRFENLVASQLLKFCHYHTDTEGHKMELCFLRDSEKREIDFVVLKNKKPLFGVECKMGEKSVSPHIAYFAPRTDIPIFFQVHCGQKYSHVQALRTEILPFYKFALWLDSYFSLEP